MSQVKYNDDYEYEVFDDGYDIYSHGILRLTQRGEFGKLFDANKSYEENAILHIESIIESSFAVQVEKLRADLDYVSIMEDIDLPSQDKGV